MRILGEPPASVRQAVVSAFRGALSSGAAAPATLAIDDDGDRWIAPLASRPLRDRRRSVVVTGSESALMTAVRLSVGGAAWLPCSSLAALESLEAVSEVSDGDGIIAEADAAELAAAWERLLVVHVSEPSFWRSQLGPGGLQLVLANLADRLDAPRALLTWPALLATADLEVDRVCEAWRGLLDERGRPMPDLLLLSVGGAGGSLEQAYRGLCAGHGERLPGGAKPSPVRELPGGRLVGRWWINEHPSADDAWSAWPLGVGDGRFQWRVVGAGADGAVAETTTSEVVADAQDVVAVRVPGWATRGLGSGTPAGILVARLAEAAYRRGLPLWIPNLERDALRFVLGLPGTLWVDGAAVPE